MSITIFGTPTCTNCKSVTRFLDSAGVGYQYKTIGQDVQHEEVNSIIGRVARSVPVIVANGSEVSFEDLRRTVTEDEMSGALAEMTL